MPHIWRNKAVVTVDELVPDWWPTQNALMQYIHYYKGKDYGIKRLQRGGKYHRSLYDFDSLPEKIQAALGDPRKGSQGASEHSN